MRKNTYEMRKEDAWIAFDNSPYAVLSCIREDASPYGVALSIARNGETLYFHCANEGEKLDCLRANPCVSIQCVESYSYPVKAFTTLYTSVVIDGVAEEVMDEEEKIIGLRSICERFTPLHMENFEDEVKRCLSITTIFKIHVNDITGKKKQ